MTAKETISDLENVDCTEDAKYLKVLESDILKFFKGKISYEEYINRITSASSNSYRLLEKELKFEQLSLFD